MTIQPVKCGLGLTLCVLTGYVVLLPSTIVSSGPLDSSAGIEPAAFIIYEGLEHPCVAKKFRQQLAFGLSEFGFEPSVTSVSGIELNEAAHIARAVEGVSRFIFRRLLEQTETVRAVAYC